MELNGTTALVTGGARGIGRELTRQLVSFGAHVVAVGSNPKGLAELAAEHGTLVSTDTVDLSDPEAVDAYTDELPQRHPGLSVVVNNAGVQNLSDFLTSDPHRIRPLLRRELAVNLDAVITLSTGLLPHLKQHPSAAIVNISSGLAVIPKPSAPVYCAAKAGVRTFTRALRYQCDDAAPHIRVIDAILPLVDRHDGRPRPGKDHPGTGGTRGDRRPPPGQDGDLHRQGTPSPRPHAGRPFARIPGVAPWLMPRRSSRHTPPAARVVF
ncbi:SDR family NAD(P)-dependent oxidoreductase [Streptomyces albipurpureus]|uniref:SDR family NAD(P)-dependent oxidoreductase n=1 Tax=Streptomyces albipurpureus TaxID=2897419 RepID=A0ABT0UIP7_9ACTN|nr:SDR family NAD(P)-dependent oxidoreductase [Streptomyces sp. CWNU-1]MCM2388319.1 SDR family NAD(P)-dependent oxidoreductase [Streptomyces sp. CWNU-1]